MPNPSTSTTTPLPPRPTRTDETLRHPGSHVGVKPTDVDTGAPVQRTDEDGGRFSCPFGFRSRCLTHRRRRRLSHPVDGRSTSSSVLGVGAEPIDVDVGPRGRDGGTFPVPRVNRDRGRPRCLTRRGRCGGTTSPHYRRR